MIATWHLHHEPFSCTPRHCSLQETAVTLSCSTVLSLLRTEPRNGACRLPHCLSCNPIHQYRVHLYLQSELILPHNNITLTETVNDRFDLRVVNGLSIPLSLNQFQNCLHDMLLSLLEHLLPPSDQVQCVYVVDILLALIHLSLHPVSVQVAEDMVVVLCCCCVSLPFTNVVGQKCFFRELFLSDYDPVQML